MRPFSIIYKKILFWSQSKFAIYWLCGISCLESFIIPYPIQDILLASMTLKNNNKAYYFAFLCTISSVIGGVIGYYIGVYAFELLLPFLTKMNYISTLTKAQKMFDDYGIWIIIIAGFSPMPYKIFTISAGMLSMAIAPFMFFSFIARAMRYYLIAFLVRKFGKSCDVWLSKYIDRLGYVFIVIIILGIFWYEY